MNIGKAIREIRREKRIRQQQVTEISQTYLSLVESGKNTPSIQGIEAIARGLGVPVARIYFKALGPEDLRKGHSEDEVILLETLKKIILTLI